MYVYKHVTYSKKKKIKNQFMHVTNQSSLLLIKSFFFLNDSNIQDCFLFDKIRIDANLFLIEYKIINGKLLKYNIHVSITLLLII